MKLPEKTYVRKYVNGKPTVVAIPNRELDVILQLKAKTFAKLNKEK